VQPFALPISDGMVGQLRMGRAVDGVAAGGWLSVRPPGAAFATEAVPIVPPAPVRCSTITFCPSAAPSSALIARARMSCTPPAPKGTTMRVTLLCAAAAQSNVTRIVVPFGAGGVQDILARAISAELGAALGQKVIVEHRTGAGGTIGTASVAKAAPGGRTLS